MVTLALFATVGMIFQGCATTGTYAKKENAPAATPGIQSAVKNSFDDVTAKLDKGGNFYMYASTENIIKGIDEFAMKLRGMLEKHSAKSKDLKEGLIIFDFIYSLYKKIGITEISGIGISSITMEEKLNHTKVMAHHYPENNKGLIWQLSSVQPHELKCLKFLPAETAVAMFGDNHLNALWAWVKKEAPSFGVPGIEKGIQKVESKLMEKGIDLNKILASFNGTSGLLITLDEKNMKTVPMSKEMTLEIPEPGLVLVFSVKDDYLYNFIKGKLPFGKVIEDEHGKRFQVMKLPLPINVQPTMAYIDGRLIIASNNQLIDKMLAAKAGNTGLMATDEYKRLAQLMPAKGNSFEYTSPRFGRTIWDLMSKVGEMQKKKDPLEKELQEFIRGFFPVEAGKFTIKQNLANGNLATINHTTSVENILLLPAAVATGVVAAIAIPNLLTAKEKGKQKATIHDMENISAAIEGYIEDHKKAPQGKSLEEIRKELEPFYIKHLPIKDAWGNPFYYKHGTGKDKKSYSIASGGKNGVMKEWKAEGCFHVKNMDDFDEPIILVNGKFTYCPTTKKTSCEETHKHKKKVKEKIKEKKHKH